jgi:hypothetical protein
MAEHGNSNKNQKPHHLYEIRDSIDDDIVKYGISHDPIGEDGYSKRMRTQIDFLNLGVKWLRFFGRILIKNIPGRRTAKRIEREHIKAYEKKYGHKPRGNKQ